MDLSRFHVITSLGNPVRYRSRYRLYNKWHRHMKACGIDPWTIEVAFGDRDFHTAHHHRNIHLRTKNELWLKECALNILVQRLPSDWEYIAWVDADIDFIEYPHGGWLEEAWHQLQHYQVIQLWQSAIDMDHQGGIIQAHESFMYCYLHNKPYNGAYGTYWHPGYAWACTREAFNGMGGFLDFAILGAGDHHQALGFIGEAKRSVPKGLNPRYLEKVLDWEHHAVNSIKKDVGYLPTTIRHHFHGHKKNRRYWSRWDVLRHSQYNPDRDIKKDWHGLFQLTDRNWRLRDDLRRYFRQRKEDVFVDEDED